MRYARRGAGGGALGAFTTGALALGGGAGNAAADGPVDRWSATYDFSYYVEDDLDASKGLPGGETERYEIEMHQLSLQAPWSDRVDLGFDLTYETMSGASPWYVVPDVNGAPIQVMSGASISDARTDLLMSGSYYLDHGRISLSSGLSTEKDYDAWNVGLQAERHFNEKNTTVSGGVGASFDTIEPTDADLFPLRPNDEDKKSVTGFIGISQLLGRSASLQTGLTWKHSSGYLSDPYKQTYVGGIFLADSRPDERDQWSWLTRYRRHFEAVSGSLHADYAFYADDWEIVSHSIELAWYQTLFETLRLIPSFRWYSQSAADFYEPYYTAARADGYHSSDYRLSAYGALGFGLALEKQFRTRWTGDRQWTAKLAWERYRSDSDYSHVDVDVENPGLVAFDVFTIALGLRF